jgi:large subunit ribosomal protein L9
MHTEVILKSKIHNLGAEADIVRVRPGYARNFLFPKGLAMPATAGQKLVIEKLRKARAEREAKELNDANEMAGKLNKMTVTFQMTSAEGSERVFGSVTSQEILERLAKNGVELDRKQLRLAHPLKEVGSHEVEIHLHSEVRAKVTVVLEVPKTEAGEESAKEGSDKSRRPKGDRKPGPKRSRPVSDEK